MKGLPVLDARAAFCDVGSEQMHVSIAGGPPKVATWGTLFGSHKLSSAADFFWNSFPCLLQHIAHTKRFLYGRTVHCPAACLQHVNR
jgi:hypothetical protein